MEGGKRQQNKFSKVVTRFHSFMGKKGIMVGLCVGVISAALWVHGDFFFFGFFFLFFSGFYCAW